MVTLTGRRREILDLLITGAQDKEIAEKLEIAPSSVASALNSLRYQAGCRSRIDLAVWYTRFLEHTPDPFPESA